jgi:hypothetical protein
VILPEITPEMEETIQRAIRARSNHTLVDAYRIQISGCPLLYIGYPAFFVNENWTPGVKYKDWIIRTLPDLSCVTLLS